MPCSTRLAAAVRRLARCAPALVALAWASCSAPAATTIEHINPASMYQSPAFSQAVTVSGPHTTVYVGGQNAVAADGTIVGARDLAAQTKQVARNLKTVLAASGATPSDVIQWTVALVEGQSPRIAFAAFEEELGPASPPPTVLVLYVPALAHPEFLLEVSAIAVVPAR